jgi:hypothetical protein
MFGVERGRARVALSANRCRGLGGGDPVRMTCDALPAAALGPSTTIARDAFSTLEAAFIEMEPDYGTW